jgi:hypothetical protein
MKFIRLLLLVVLLVCAFACIEDTIQLDNISNDIAIERQQALPLIRASFRFEDIAGHGYDSLIVQSGDTIFLYLIQDIGFHDTLKLGDMGKDIDFEYLNLYYKITSMFAVGLDLQFYLYDSVLSQNIDTIFFSRDPDHSFLEPAPVNANGLVIEDQVVPTKSFISLDQDLLYNLFHGATHLVVDATVPSTGGYVKILNYYRLDMRLGLGLKGRYITSLDSIRN